MNETTGNTNMTKKQLQDAIVALGQERDDLKTELELKNGCISANDERLWNAGISVGMKEHSPVHLPEIMADEILGLRKQLSDIEDNRPIVHTPNAINNLRVLTTVYDKTINISRHLNIVMNVLSCAKKHKGLTKEHSYIDSDLDDMISDLRSAINQYKDNGLRLSLPIRLSDKQEEALNQKQETEINANFYERG